MSRLFSLLLFTFVVLGCVDRVFSQSLSSQDRDRAVIMLKAARDDIRKNYYDPNFRGIDLDAKTKAAEERIKQAKSNGEVFGIIAQMLLDFNDSHTIFLPPQRLSSGVWLADAGIWQRLLRHRGEAKERRRR